MREEQILQQHVASYLAVALGPRTFWTAVGHGGGGAVRGAILKSMGLVAGIPDLLVWWPNHCLGLELKSGAGRISLAQRETHKRMGAAGVPVFLARSLDDVRIALRAAGCPLREHDFNSGRTAPA